MTASLPTSLPTSLPVSSTTSDPALTCVWDAQALLGEGAYWSTREQALYWVDILGGQLHRWNPSSDARTSWHFDSFISAVTECADAPGLLLALRHSVAYWDPAQPSSAPQTLCVLEPDAPRNRCNDGKCDAMGRFWVGTMDASCAQPTGALYCVDAKGRKRLVATGFVVTNGPTWTQDQRTMLFNDTARGRVWAYDFDAEHGRLHHRRLWLQFASDEGLPDGMCTDAAGRIWICHWGGGCVTCHDPVDAHELDRIELPVRQVTSCAFGGEDGRTLFITTAREGLSDTDRLQQPLAGGLFARRMDVSGLPPQRFAGA